MLSYRKAAKEDVMLYYKWTNEESVRKQSFNSETISIEDHIKWFEKKIEDADCIMLLFEDEEKQPAGQIRLQEEDAYTYVIGISVDAAQRGKGYASQMLRIASDYFFNLYPSKKIHAYIKQDNFASIHAFEKAGYTDPEKLVIKGINSFKYLKNK